MSESKEILNSEEVEFLLEVAATPSSDEISSQPGSRQVVTMRGDLQQMHLSDIFQTLGMAKMEGLLKVSNPVEQRMVHFKAGMVRILVPPRSATRRLGQRLVQAGVLEPEQLRLALLEQRRDKNNSPLGRILVMGGYVPQHTIDSLVSLQVTEELFGLFTWEHGEFEFYRGPVDDPGLKDRLLHCPEFEVNSLLLEVARRADEWEDILAALRSLDEVPLPCNQHKVDVSQLSEEHRSILVAVDGRLTYRDLADVTASSIFDCGRVARDLMQWKLIAPATDEHLLEIARWHQEQGHGKKALMLAQTLRDRPGDRPVQLTRDISQLVRTIGEPRIACQILLQAAQLQTDPREALDLAREARAMSPRDLGAMAFLRTTMLAHMEHDAPEIETVTLDLIDGLLHDGDAERVLSLVDEVKFLGTATPAILVRQARALSKKKDNSAAIDVLLQAADAYAATDDKERRLEVLELAFRLDRDRRDIQKLIRQLKSTPRARVARWGSVAAVLTILLGTGAMWFVGHLREQRLRDAGTEIEGLLGEQDLAGARAALQRLRASIGDSPLCDDLEQQVLFAEANELKRLQREAMRANADQLNAAGQRVLAGDLAGGFAIYDRMAKDPNLAKEIAEASRTRLTVLHRQFQDVVQHLANMLPAPPDEFAEQSYIEEMLSMLRTKVSTDLLAAADRVIEHQEQGRMPATIDAELRRELVDLARQAKTILERGQQLTEAFRTAAMRYETQRRLDPLFKAALDHEAALRFEQALAAYRKLYASRAGTDDLRDHLAGKISRLEGIVGMCAAIDAATKKGDFATANREYQALLLAAPETPFHQIIRLPVTVRTSVPGATIKWNGAEIGRTPKLVSYLPGNENILEFQLDGFFDVKLPLPPRHGGLFNALMTLRPTWTCQITGTDQAMAMDSAGRVFATQRDGSVLAVDAREGRQLWRYESNDLAGYVTPPQLYRDTVLVASLDGPLRAIESRSGDVRWTRPGLATEFAAALVGSRFVLATTDGQLKTVSADTGEDVAALELPTEAVGDLVAIGRTVFVPMVDGGIVAYDAAEGVRLWRSLPREFGTGLVATDLGLIAQRDDGQTSLLDPRTGQVRWQVRLSTTPIGLADARDGRLLVTLDGSLLVLDLRTGKDLWTAPRPEEGWAGPARFLANHLAAPTRDDTILVYSLYGMLPRYRLLGDRAVSLFGASTTFALVAAGGTLHFYRELP